MRISENQVKIEGILSEVGLETATFNRKGQYRIWKSPNMTQQ